MPARPRISKSGVAKHIDVETLIRAKYQHNLEFAQFLKSLWDSNASGHALDEYDAVGLRSAGKGAASMAIFQPGAGGGAGAKPSARAGASRRPAAAGAPPSSRRPAGRTASGGRAAARSGSSGAATPGSGVSAAAARALDKLRTENAELRKGMQALEREREFYFSKLRDVRSRQCCGLLCTGARHFAWSQLLLRRA